MRKAYSQGVEKRPSSSQKSVASWPRGFLDPLARLCSAAAQSNGDVREILRLTGIGANTLRQRVSRLRTAGLVRTVIVFDPLKIGRACQFTTWVRMATMSSSHIVRFERDLIDDDAILVADRVAGDADYRLSSFHANLFEASVWTQCLRCRPEVAQVRQTVVRHVFGHTLHGIVLHGASPEDGLDDPDLVGADTVEAKAASLSSRLDAAA